MTADTSRRSCGALVTGRNGGLGRLGADSCRNTARPGDKFRCPAAHSVPSTRNIRTTKLLLSRRLHRQSMGVPRRRAAFPRTPSTFAIA